MILLLLNLIWCYSFQFFKYPSQNIYDVDDVIIKWDYPENISLPTCYYLNLYQNNKYLTTLNHKNIYNKSLLKINTHYLWNIDNDYVGTDFNLGLNLTSNKSIYYITGYKFNIMNSDIYYNKNYFNSVSFIFIIFIFTFIIFYLSGNCLKKTHDSGNVKRYYVSQP